MIGIHCKSESKDIVESLQTLLLFLLADPRANRPQNPFTNINDPQKLKDSQKPLLGQFLDETDMNQAKIDEIISEYQSLLSKIENEEFIYKWHTNIMKEQIVC